MSLVEYIIPVIKYKLKLIKTEINRLDRVFDEGMLAECNEQILTKHYAELLIREQILQQELERYEGKELPN